jgi:hypothetical protein
MAPPELNPRAKEFRHRSGNKPGPVQTANINNPQTKHDPLLFGFSNLPILTNKWTPHSFCRPPFTSCRLTKPASILISTLPWSALASAASATLADETAINIVAQEAGATPFICKLKIACDQPDALHDVSFAIMPKAGSITRPISAGYPVSYLSHRGYAAQQLRGSNPPHCAQRQLRRRCLG